MTAPCVFCLTPGFPVAMFEKYRNPNGTYNGVAMLHDLSGISQDEIYWTLNRLRELMRSGTPQSEAVRVVKEEAKEKPWLKP